MKKLISKRMYIICAICLVVFMLSGFSSFDLINTDAEKTPDYVTVPIYINGIKMAEGYKLTDTTYVNLKAFFDAFGIQTDIAWEEETKTAILTAENLKLIAMVGSNYIAVNDRYFYLPHGVLNIEGSISIPIRELAKIYQYEVYWDNEAALVEIKFDDTEFLESADKFYNNQDLYWLSRLINAEAGNQPLEGKIAVGNVVLNRVADPSYPDTIFGVIFDSKYGVQFCVTQTGGIYLEPNEESIIAAKICLEGYNLAENSVYFVNPSVGISSWFSNTRVFVASIGEHDFYA